MHSNFPDHTNLSTDIAALLSRELNISVSDVNVDLPLTQYGLDSIAALTIAGELEDRFGLTLPSTLLWDCPTVNALAKFLHNTLQSREPTAALS